MLYHCASWIIWRSFHLNWILAGASVPLQASSPHGLIWPFSQDDSRSYQSGVDGHSPKDLTLEAT